MLDKVGTFGILRYCLPLFPEASQWFAPWALALAVIGIIYAALLAVGQNDLKRLVSYTSIAHFGFIGVGIFAFTTQAGTGAVLYMLNHGLATGLLFLVVGMLVPGAARRWSATSAAPASWCRCWPGCCSSPVSPRWRCPARRRSSPSSWC